jgi:membrane fusion protein, multidrug efflux system
VRRARLALAGALLLAAAPLAGCGGKLETAQLKAPPVMVAPVEAHRVVDRIEATGQLLAQAEATVAAQVAGQITQVHVEEGDAVAAGDVLLEIDPERRELELANTRAGLTEAQAQVGERERELARVRQLHARGAASAQKLDETETALRLARSRSDAAEAQLRLTERSLRDSTVRAPFSGLVARRRVSEGEFVAAGTPLVHLVALDPVEVEFFLPERDSARATIGDPVDVSVAPYPKETFRAEVSVISPTIDSATRTLRVKALLPNPDGRLRPGLFARADLGVAEREGVPMIPEDAILQRADGAVAFRLVADSKVERRNLRLGVYRDGLVEVVDGLVAGDVVVVRGQAGLVDGSPVSLRDAEGQPVEREGVSADASIVAPRSDTP